MSATKRKRDSASGSGKPPLVQDASHKVSGRKRRATSADRSKPQKNGDKGGPQWVRTQPALVANPTEAYLASLRRKEAAKADLFERQMREALRIVQSRAAAVRDASGTLGAAAHRDTLRALADYEASLRSRLAFLRSEEKIQAFERRARTFAIRAASQTEAKHAMMDRYKKALRRQRQGPRERNTALPRDPYADPARRRDLQSRLGEGEAAVSGSGALSGAVARATLGPTGRTKLRVREVVGHGESNHQRILRQLKTSKGGSAEEDDGTHKIKSSVVHMTHSGSYAPNGGTESDVRRVATSVADANRRDAAANRILGSTTLAQGPIQGPGGLLLAPDAAAARAAADELDEETALAEAAVEEAKALNESLTEQIKVEIERQAPAVRMVTNDICPNPRCRKPMRMSTTSMIMVCPNPRCKTRQTYLEAVYRRRFAAPITQAEPRTTYDRMERFRLLLNQLRGRERRRIPLQLRLEVLEELWQDKVPLRNITPSLINVVQHHLQEVLCKNKKGKPRHRDLQHSIYYMNHSQLFEWVTGIMSPQLDKETVTKASLMFLEMQAPFQRIVPKAVRSNFLNYSPCAFRIMDQLGRVELLEYFNLLKGPANFSVQRTLFRAIADEIGWESTDHGPLGIDLGYSRV